MFLPGKRSSNGFGHLLNLNRIRDVLPLRFQFIFPAVKYSYLFLDHFLFIGQVNGLALSAGAFISSSSERPPSKTVA
jgi:hypothetical protein